jgi:aminoglycoside phosphotransferase family enzyme/predicted kinase
MDDTAVALDRHRQLVTALSHRLGQTSVLVQTHISTLLLAGEFAYKLRKPLTLDFLDFSTPELRRADCEAELRLNRRTAPQLYLDVLPVLGPLAQARFGRAEEVGGGEIIDWALRMQRFDNAGLLDRMANAGTLTPQHIDALAQRVAAFHAALPASPAGHGDPQQLLRRALENFDALDAAAAGTPHRARLRHLRAWTNAEFGRVAPTLAQRRAQGLVREGHGDLHLGNIVLIDGEPLPFDCIEFNAELRHLDVMGDAAFTFMDLVRHGLPGHAWRFINGYVEHGGDAQGVMVLPFWAVYRAMVRAKVAMLRAAQATGGSETQAQALQALQRDLRLAELLSALGQAKPWLVVTSGLSGSGKSTLALALAESLGAIRLRSDVERKRLHGLLPSDRPPPQQAQALYGAPATQRTYARLQTLAGCLLRAGRPVIVDSAALRRHERDALRDLAHASGARFALVVCEAPEAVLRERVARRLAESNDASDATLAVLARQLSLREPVTTDEHAIVLDTRAAPAALTDQLLRQLAVASQPQ